MLYEVVVILRPELSGQQAESVVRSFEPALSEKGGVVEGFEYAGLKPFAYPVRKYTKGHYVLLNLTAPAKAVQELCRLMKLNEDILRFLNVKVEAHAALPSVLSQNRYDRDDFEASSDDRGAGASESEARSAEPSA